MAALEKLIKRGEEGQSKTTQATRSSILICREQVGKVG